MAPILNYLFDHLCRALTFRIILPHYIHPIRLLAASNKFLLEGRFREFNRFSPNFLPLLCFPPS